MIFNSATRISRIEIRMLFYFTVSFFPFKIHSNDITFFWQQIHSLWDIWPFLMTSQQPMRTYYFFWWLIHNLWRHRTTFYCRSTICWHIWLLLVADLQFIGYLILLVADPQFTGYGTSFSGWFTICKDIRLLLEADPQFIRILDFFWRPICNL